jgi:hypothetical protein
MVTIAGVVMMLGRGSLRFLVRTTLREFRRAGPIARTSRPHFHLHDEAHSKKPGY